MGRLIDADSLVKEIEKKLYEGEQQLRWMRNGKTLTQGIVFGLDGARKIILKQSTAYDLDKVVEQIEKLKKAEQNRSDNCDETGFGDGEQIFDDGRSQGRYEAFGEAIKIVKGGGVDGN